MSGDDVLTMPSARRIEVFTGAGRRRRWSAETKARIVAESYATSVAIYNRDAFAAVERTPVVRHDNWG